MSAELTPATPPPSPSTPAGATVLPEVTDEDEKCFHEAHSAFHGCHSKHSQYENSAYRVIAKHRAAATASAVETLTLEKDFYWAKLTEARAQLQKAEAALAAEVEAHNETRKLCTEAMNVLTKAGFCSGNAVHVAECAAKAIDQLRIEVGFQEEAKEIATDKLATALSKLTAAPVNDSTDKATAQLWVTNHETGKDTFIKEGPLLQLTHEVYDRIKSGQDAWTRAVPPAASPSPGEQAAFLQTRPINNPELAVLLRQEANALDHKHHLLPGLLREAATRIESLASTTAGLTAAAVEKATNDLWKRRDKELVTFRNQLAKAEQALAAEVEAHSFTKIALQHHETARADSMHQYFEADGSPRRIDTDTNAELATSRENELDAAKHIALITDQLATAPKQLAPQSQAFHQRPPIASQY